MFNVSYLIPGTLQEYDIPSKDTPEILSQFNLISAAIPKLKPAYPSGLSSPVRLKPVKKLGPPMVISSRLNGKSGGFGGVKSLSSSGLSGSGFRVGVDTGPDVLQPWQWSQKEKMDAKEELVSLVYNSFRFLGLGVGKN